MTTHTDAVLKRLMTLHPKVIDLSLGRMHRILAALGNPERALPPVIHIAGTNGKGSTQAMLRAGLEAAGTRVHAYTSPHLVRFNERIRLAGELISDEALNALLDECEAANGGEQITFFEVTTAAAILGFSRVPADWLLLEVGLGGVLDATNVVDQPALTVITPVSMDHEHYLGDKLTMIAGEKAGIIKRGVPCVVSKQEDEALEVIEARAARLGAPLLVYGQHWHVREEFGRLVFEDERGLLDLPPPVLPGPHQFLNAGGVIAGLRHLGFGDEACEAALTRAEWPARMQRLTRGPLAQSAPEVELWLDGGHNPAAGLAIAATLDRLAKRPTYAICGMLNTKDVRGFMTPLQGHLEGLIAVSIPGELNTLSAEVTRAAAEAAGIPAEAAASPAEAFARIAARDPQARVLICGSLYLAGRILAENG